METGILDYLVNAANVLYLLSYFVRDMMKLRMLTVAAASCLIFYFYSQPEPLMACIWWNLFFVGQNLVGIARLLIKRRRVGRRRPERAGPRTRGPSALPLSTSLAA